ncbi:hypothetical protein HWI79_3193 [Cryptosporidium felis]|nr:hypothetical protein HWI79_3193 [Cryptosporidium felis]
MRLMYLVLLYLICLVQTPKRVLGADYQPVQGSESHTLDYLLRVGILEYEYRKYNHKTTTYLNLWTKNENFTRKEMRLVDKIMAFLKGSVEISERSLVKIEKVFSSLASELSRKYPELTSRESTFQQRILAVFTKYLSECDCNSSKSIYGILISLLTADSLHISWVVMYILWACSFAMFLSLENKQHIWDSVAENDFGVRSIMIRYSVELNEMLEAIGKKNKGMLKNKSKNQFSVASSLKGVEFIIKTEDPEEFSRLFCRALVELIATTITEFGRWTFALFFLFRFSSIFEAILATELFLQTRKNNLTVDEAVKLIIFSGYIQTYLILRMLDLYKVELSEMRQGLFECKELYHHHQGFTPSEEDIRGIEEKFNMKEKPLGELRCSSEPSTSSGLRGGVLYPKYKPKCNDFSSLFSVFDSTYYASRVLDVIDTPLRKKIKIETPQDTDTN